MAVVKVIKTAGITSDTHKHTHTHTYTHTHTHTDRQATDTHAHTHTQAFEASANPAAEEKWFRVCRRSQCVA